MNIHLENIKKLLQDTSLPEEEKQLLLKQVADADKQWAITDFKLDRTEKVKKTTAILLEETIEELENKRKAVEAQNRELEIETALERVRTVAMAMRKPADLPDICKIVYTELHSLGFTELRNAMINIHYDDKSSLLNYDYSNNSGKTVTDIPYNFHPLVEKQVMVTKNAQDAFFEFSFTGEELKQFRELRKNNGEQDDPKLEITDALHYYFFSIGTGSIGISTYSAIPEEKLELLKRFRNVFNLSYQRYTDIALAEAQAREAKIEAALEKVRSRSMGMQKSEELKEVIQVVYEQFVHLGIHIEHTGFIMDYKTKDDMHIWLADKHEVPSQVTIPYFDCAHWNSFIEAKEKGTDFFANHLSFEEKNKFYQDLFKLLPGVPQETLDYYFSCPGLAISTVLLENVGLYIENFSGIPYSVEENNILMRFGKVFQQTYTRFLDLQKAEAQAREAQIELGLERVRARAMAMQKSEELSELVDTVFKELTKLDFALNWCIINIIDERSMANSVWAANPDIDKAPESYYMKFEDYPYHHAMLKDWRERKTKSVYTLEGKEKQTYDDYLFNETAFKRTPEIAQAASRAMSKYVCSFSFCNFGGLQTVGDEPLSEASMDILARFGKVFDLTYTRFNDLQKAEAQAREAQIELALERVRARTMAMQKSDELSDTAYVLFQQFKELGENPHQITIGMIKEAEGFVEFNITGADGSGAQINRSFKFDINEPALIQKLVKAWKENKKSSVIELAGKDLTNWVAHRNLVSGIIDNTDYSNARRFVAAGFFTKGLISISTIDFIETDTCSLLERFAKVFEQTYTRFLDLQKAEAQAREAIIETALERVRSKTMAMHNSQDVGDTVATLFEEFVKLGIDTFRCGIGIIHQEKKMEVWTAKRDANGKVNFFTGHMDMTIHPLLKGAYSAWKKKQDSYVYELKGDDLKEYFSRSNNNPNYPLKYDIPSLPSRLIFSVFYFPEGFLFAFTLEELSAEATKIFKRFSGVFGQTYTRFLDLQKAEAQTREAKIEAALEKVRSRTMAMQRSEELQDAASLMVQQIQTLGVPQFGSGFNIWDDDRKAATAWMSNVTTDNLPPSFKTSSSEDIFLLIHDAAQRGELLFVKEQAGEELKTHYGYMNSIPIFREYVERASPEGLSIPDFQIMHCVFFSQGYLMFITYEPVPEAHEIFKRFAKVFEQTYTRFLDLQKAEAQAREAKIEAALEKVRSRSLAMHKSDDLGEVVTVVFDKLRELGLEMDDKAAIIMTFPGDTKDSFQWITDPVKSYTRCFKIPYVENLELLDFDESRKSSELFFEKIYTREEKNPSLQYLFDFTDYKYLPDEIKSSMLESNCYSFSAVYSKNSGIAIPDIKGRLLSVEDKEIIKRIAKVFEQAYIRFLDLQKAEAQAREAEIELALERVRARTMAMHNSSELAEVAVLLFQQIKHLGAESFSSGFNIWDNEHKNLISWMSNATGNINPPFELPINDYEQHRRIFAAWEKQELFLQDDLKGKALTTHYKFLRSFPLLDESFKQAEEAGIKIPDRQVHNVVFFSNGYLLFITQEPTPQYHGIFQRFGKVFDQTYTRFLDLQKAEAQAREAEIELALERVRARTMAMQQSNELPEAANILFQQIQSLGMTAWSAGYCIWEDDLPAGEAGKKAITLWMSSEGVLQPPFRAPLTEDPSFIHQLEAYQRGETFYVEEVGGSALVKHYKYMRTLPVVGEILDSIINAGHPLPTFQIFHCAYFSQGFLLFITYEPVPEAHEIFKRFGKVFDQTYTRFLDLQKAEAQARETTIEAALEKVRSRSLAMHKSDELGDVVSIVYAKLKELEVTIDATIIFTFPQNSTDVIHWLANPSLLIPFANVRVPYFDNALCNAFYGAREKELDFYSRLFSFEEKNSYWNYVFEHTDYKYFTDFKKSVLKTKAWASSVSVSKNSAILIGNETGRMFSERENDIVKRFGKVFEQAYIRFLDLQKAEAQAREATIEASLERVRSKAMAMHSSEDLAATIGVFYRELESLHITPRRCGVGLLNKETKIAELSTMNTTEQGQSIEIIGKLKLLGHPVLEGIFENWLTQTEYHPVLRGNDIKEYYQLLKPQIGFPDYPNDAVQFGYFFFFNEGGVYAWTEKELLEDELIIYRRFTSVLSLTYKRYQDLKQSEAQTKEAQIEAALERVRSRTLAMQKSDELAETAAVMFQQLIQLGIAPNRLYIIIIKEQAGDMEAWVTDEDGSRVSKGFTGNFNNNESLHTMYSGWKEKRKSLVIDMQGEELQNYFHYLHKELKVPFKGGLEQKRRVQHIAFFGSGLIGIASPEPQPEETMQLLERFAAAFNLTYTRFNDLKVAEAHAVQAEEDLAKLQTEKKRAEDALTELQATQKQLIQSEKMASLGELTAGIAHEIQNPLNFVNNFSEVSNELIDEMNDELNKGDIEEARAIANDIKQNLEKINHHGKRADAIVKGMLQHSSAGSGAKEPTDINVLTDEYIRLCYHGLRSKDKSFYATIKTNFDNTLEKINIIPQDIGRVVLNLLTNAFYAANEKKQQNINGYEPTVSVNTKKIDNMVEIKIVDNGNGIPQKIVDKIFQPFFTTKPTGQGTGLGLSLSYDIVKAHDGEIKVETKEGEGTTFIIQLLIS